MDALSANLQKKLWTAHKDPGRPSSYFYENSEELRADRKTVAETVREMRENDMALQEKKIMPPPWLAHREIERYSIGWRMGYGENYIVRFGDWLETPGFLLGGLRFSPVSEQDKHPTGCRRYPFS